MTGMQASARAGGAVGTGVYLYVAMVVHLLSRHETSAIRCCSVWC